MTAMAALAGQPMPRALPALRVLPPPSRLGDQTESPESEPYALTSMQRLFFAMDELRPELGLQAWQFLLEGPLDTVLLRRALLAVIERHTVLRSGFGVDAQGQPCQRVFPMAALARLPWLEDDLRGLPGDGQELRLQEARDAEARQRLTLDRPPLMRIRLLRVADERWHLLWTTHHLMLDGWSWPLLLAEWSRTYAALDAGRTPHEPAAVPFRRYVEAVARPSEDELAFWQSQLAGFAVPTPLTAPDPAGLPAPVETITEVAPELAAELLVLARRLRTTPGTLFNAAWALALAHGCASPQVAFGITVAGRPAELEGIERLIGPCVNNVPLCVELDPATPLADWVATLHARQRAIAQRQTTPLDVIQAQSAVPWRHRLFDSLVVFQNYLASVRGSAAACWRPRKAPTST
jgi:Condensation domain